MINSIISLFLKKNINLKNRYQDETCYIFGNGSSLKRISLKHFSDFYTFSCNWMSLHKDYKLLKKNIGYALTTPFWFSPIFRNTYSKKFRYNMGKKTFLKNFCFEKENLFTSISNYPFLINKPNVNYLHDFGNKNLDIKFHDLTGTFSLMSSAIYAMIGIAKYMGFKKIILVGMDYLYNYPFYGHFYERKSNTIFDINEKSFKQKRIKDILFFQDLEKNIDLLLLAPEGSSSGFIKTISYKNFFATQEENFTNYDLVNLNNLNLLDKCEFRYNIFQDKY